MLPGSAFRSYMTTCTKSLAVIVASVADGSIRRTVAAGSTAPAGPSADCAPDAQPTANAKAIDESETLPKRNHVHRDVDFARAPARDDAVDRGNVREIAAPGRRDVFASR